MYKVISGILILIAITFSVNVSYAAGPNWKIYSVRDEQVAMVDVATQVPLIMEYGKVIKAKLSGEKLKYFNSAGENTVSIKGDRSRFKLKSASGSLLWKVKVSDTKIKICDDEECRLPYEISFGQDKVKFKDKKIASLKRKGSGLLIEGQKEAYKLKTSVKRSSFVVLGIDDINFKHRLILLAELLKRGY